MEITQVKISDVILSEYNPRKISQGDKKDLKKSLEKFGMVDPIILNKNKDRFNVLIGGHQRLKIWKELGHKEIPAVYFDLCPDHEKELNIRLNKNLGEFDFEKLEQNFKTDHLVDWGFSPFQFEQITFIPDETNTIEIDHKHSEAKSKDEAVMLEIPMSPTEKKEIMLIINQFKKNRDISNGTALYEICCINSMV